MGNLFFAIGVGNKSCTIVATEFATWAEVGGNTYIYHIAMNLSGSSIRPIML